MVEGRDTDELTLQRLHVHGSKVTCTLESKCTKTLIKRTNQIQITTFILLL